MIRRILTTEPALCTGCRICELVCSLSNTGELNLYRARLNIVIRDVLGSFTPIICRHCIKPLCQSACPIPEAMLRDEKTGAVTIIEDHCIGCRACFDACPFGAIRLDPEGSPLKCDLCGGDPLCVRHCPPRPLETPPDKPPIEQSCLQYLKPHRTGNQGIEQSKRED